MNGNITDCININNITNIDEYYLDEYNKTYYSCNNSKFNSVNNCKKCKNKDSCYLCNDEYTFINGNKTYCIKKNYLNNHNYQDPNYISNYESCTKIDPNCDTCSSYNICTFCFDNFGLYKNQDKCINLTENKYYKNNSDNFYYLCNNTIERCVQCLNDSICLNCDEEIYTLKENTCLKISDLGNKYYKDLNTLHYVPCNHGVNYCEICLSEKECIKCFHNYTKIDNINSSCYLIDELNQKYYPDPNDNSNYIKCSNLVKNCLKCNNTQCLLCENDYIFINYNYTSCILKSSINLSLYFTEDNITYFYCLDDKYKNNSKCINVFPNNEYTIFILQAQIIDNYLLLFILPDSISKNIFFSLTLIANTKILLRNLEQREISVQANLFNKNINKISELIVDLKNYNLNKNYDYEIKDIKIVQNGQNNINYYFNYPENPDNLNTGKVNDLIKEGEINFYDKEINSDYKINEYKIQGISQNSQNCNFNLIANKNINNDKAIILKFEKINEKSNIINANCELSSTKNQINCSLSQDINDIYILKDYIYYDENELFTIILDDRASDYFLI